MTPETTLKHLRNAYQAMVRVDDWMLAEVAKVRSMEARRRDIYNEQKALLEVPVTDVAALKQQLVDLQTESWKLHLALDAWYQGGRPKAQKIQRAAHTRWEKLAKKLLSAGA